MYARFILAARNRRLSAAALAALAVIFLPACATEPRITNATPSSISIWRDPAFVPEQEAADIAQRHCQAQGRNATIIGERGAILDFRCVR